MRINYVIATWNGFTKRNHRIPLPEDILKVHIEKIFKLKNSLSQVTIMKAESPNYYKNYYNFDSNSKIVKIECDNYGYSEGQWLTCYEKYEDNFDYYIFIEDDYIPNIDGFDDLLLREYKENFSDNIGLLCSLVQGEKNNKNTHPKHFEWCILISKETLKKLYCEKKWEKNPKKWLDLLNRKHHPSFSENYKKNNLGGYYQLSFSHLFTLTNIEIKDYLYKYNFYYWHDDKKISKGGSLIFFGDKESENIDKCIIVPIQLYNHDEVKYYIP